MSSIFTKIVAGEIPSYKIAEDEQYLAFLDAMPLVKGHTLVIPKKETDFIFDLENEDFKNKAKQLLKKDNLTDAQLLQIATLLIDKQVQQYYDRLTD
mgnify:CR=1 FL=1